MRIPITLKNIKSQLLLLTIVLFVGVGLFWQAEIREMLFSSKGTLFTGTITPLAEQELAGPLSITLPKEETAPELEKPEKEPLITITPKEETPSPVLERQPQTATPTSELSKEEILRQVEEISAKIVLLTEKAEKLAKSEQEKKVVGESVVVLSTGQEKEARLAEIQAKINDIAAQIETISQTINKLVQEKQASGGTIQI